MAILPVFSQLLRNLKFIFLGSHRNLFFEVISFFNLLHLKLLKCVKKNAILRKIFWYKVFSNEISSTQFPYRFHLNVFLWPITAKISLCNQVIIDAVACSLVFPVTVVNTIYAINVEEAWKTNSGLPQASYAIA